MINYPWKGRGSSVAEQLFCKQQVVGPNPTLGSVLTNAEIAQW